MDPDFRTAAKGYIDIKSEIDNHY